MNTMHVIYLFLWSMVFGFGHGNIHQPSQNAILKIDADVDTRSGPLKIGVVTWNMAERSPLRSDCNFLHDYDDCDVIALGLQECEDIRPRRREGRRLRKWRELRDSVYRKDFQCVREVKLGGLHLSLLIKKSKLRILKRAKTFAIPCGVGNILANKGAVGVILRLNNKKTIAFVNAHLAAHQEMVKVRNLNFKRIIQALQENLPLSWVKPTGVRFKKLLKKSRSSRTRKQGQEALSLTAHAPNALLALAGVQSSTVPVISCRDVLDACFFFGDLNYRVDLPMLQMEMFCNAFGYPREGEDTEDLEDTKEKEGDLRTTVSCDRLQFHPHSAEEKSLSASLSRILKHDQLTKEMRKGRAFADFEEMPIEFPPSFKYDKRSPTFDSKKGRCPAWTDRILFAGPNPANQQNGDSLKPLSYQCYDVRSSDHRPVGGKFRRHFTLERQQQ